MRHWTLLWLVAGSRTGSGDGVSVMGNRGEEC